MLGKIRVRIHYDHRSRLIALLLVALLVAVFLGCLAWGRIAASAADDQPAWAVSILQPAAVQTWYAPAPRSYYLTSSYAPTGATADTACAAGYHMASLWEIADPSHLRYNTALGDAQGDSGYGPPTITYGWVRTGYDSDNSGLAGKANCNVWSSSNAGHYGSVVRLPTGWSVPADQDVGVWNVNFQKCDLGAPVWCVADTVGNGVCDEPLHISDGQQVDGDTSTYNDNISGYNCSPWNESGPETLYAFTLPAGDFYTVTAALSNHGSVDLDVFILSSTGCGNPGQCLAVDSFGDETAMAGPVPPGTYYIAVDGFNGVSGTYSIDLTVESGAGEKIYMPLVLK